MYLTEVICLDNFITLLMNRKNYLLLQLLRQFLLIPNIINKFMGLLTKFTLSCFNQFCWNLINTWQFVSFQFFSRHLNTTGTGLWHQLLCHMYFSLSNIIKPRYILLLRQMFSPHTQILWEFATSSSFSSFTIVVLAGNLYLNH